MESLFAVVDIFFVSKLGDPAMAAVGLTESMLTLVYTAAMGLGIGTTAMVARRTGEGDREGAARATVQAVVLGFGAAALIGVAGAVFAPDLLRLMGADEAVVETGTSYTRIMLGGNVVIMLLFLQNAAFRGAGDAATAMRVLWLANGLNIVLDPLLIFGLGPFPELGVQGAAVATTIGRGTAVLVQMHVLLRRGGNLRVRRPDLRLRPAVMARLVRLSAALAGYVIGVRIVLFALLPAWGLANAAATMVGQSLGAGQPERAERAVWLACKMNLAFLGVVGVVFFAFAPALAGLFGGSAETAAVAASCLRIVAAGFFFYAYGMVLTAAFNGAGAVWTPTVINLFCFWLWEVPLAWFLAFPLGMGPNGVFLAIAIAFSTLAVVSGALFKRGSWKTARA